MTLLSQLSFSHLASGRVVYWKYEDQDLITLSDDVLKAIDKLSGQSGNRSEFIETALRAYIAQVARKKRNARDLKIINQHADRLKEEALDILTYQDNS